MKYIRINSIASGNVFMQLGCSECGNRVEKSDKFCRMCGHKLIPIINNITSEELLKLLNDHKNFFIAEECDKPTDKKEMASGKEKGDVTSENDLSCHSVCTCTGGRHSSEDCPHITTDGYCTLLVCTSMPPQYQKCKFSMNCVNQFKYCSEVGGLKN